MHQLIAILLLSLSMAACSKGDQARVPAQLWNDIIFKIETHPYPVKAGFNEIWLKSTKKKGTPASSLIVWLRSNESAEWVQSVQDGHIGVFRRAVKIEEGDEYLYVKLKRGTEETVLHFELPWPQEQ